MEIPNFRIRKWKPCFSWICQKVEDWLRLVSRLPNQIVKDDKRCYGNSVTALSFFLRAEKKHHHGSVHVAVAIRRHCYLNKMLLSYTYVTHQKHNLTLYLHSSHSNTYKLWNQCIITILTWQVSACWFLNHSWAKRTKTINIFFILNFFSQNTVSAKTR